MRRQTNKIITREELITLQNINRVIKVKNTLLVDADTIIPYAIG